MRLTNIRRADGSRTLAALDAGGKLIDASKIGLGNVESVRDAYGRGEDFISGLERAIATASESARIDETSISLLPLSERCSKIFCVGLNYVGHAQELGMKIPKFPSIFSRYASTAVPHEGAIVLPKSSQSVDWEGELALVIGKPTKYIDEAGARARLAGVTCFNDVSMRDFQERLPRITLAKNFDASGPIGPFLVTLDEAGNLDDLMLETRVNGVTKQKASTKEFIFSIDYLVSLISQVCLLQPGDVIATGTPGGVGWAAKPPTYLKAGDIVEVDIQNVGVLRNRVTEEG